MIKHTPWLERKFDFGYPVSHFPFFIERLRGIHPRLVDMTQGLTEKQLEKRNGTSWSIKEHIGHLTDLESLHESRIDDFLNGAAVLHAADMSNQKTISANHAATSSESLLSTFKKTRNHFISRLASLSDEQLALSAIHPRLQKPMRLADMTFFVAEHDDHHLVLIRKILEDKNL